MYQLQLTPLFLCLKTIANFQRMKSLRSSLIFDTKFTILWVWVLLVLEGRFVFYIKAK